MQTHTIKRFIKKHEQALVFLGALIVFLTFITKDAVREQLRDLTDSVDAAKDAAIIRTNFDLIAVQLRNIEEEISNKDDNDDELGNECSPLTVAKTTQDARQIISRISPVLANLPGPDRERGLVDQNNLLNRLGSVDHRSEEFKPSVTDFPKGFEECFGISVEANNGLAAAINLQNGVLEYATEWSERKRRYYHICTWASYVL